MIAGQGMIPLFYHNDKTLCYEVVRALYAGGARIIEFTNRGEKAIDNFKHLLMKRDTEWPDLLLAIGTIKDEKDAKAFIKSGADFIIAPGIVQEVAKTARESDLLWVPGCMTTTEIMLAESSDASLIKLFPGNVLGPLFLSAIKEIFPGIRFMPTGGVEVEKENLREWFKAGVCAVGIGSKLVTNDILVNKHFDNLAQRTKDALAMVKEIKDDVFI